MGNSSSIQSLDEAIAFFQKTMAAHPERDADAARRAIVEGRRRPYPCIYLNHLSSPDDTDVPQDDFVVPAVSMPEGTEASLARELMGMLEPLKMLNPVSGSFGLGIGPGSLAPSFGLTINVEAQNSPDGSRNIDELLAEPPPDPKTSGLMPGMLEKIRQIRALTPPEFMISMPDRQGPFNLAHMVLGTEVFTEPLIDPDKFHAVMQRITDFWIQVRTTLVEAIGPERINPWYWDSTIVCECSCNMISPDMYKEFVLPYDLQIARHQGCMAIHPCSGPHVFRETLENLPNVVYIEAGFIEKTAAGAMDVGEALKELNGRPIALGIGQELPPGAEYEFICRDLDRYRQTPRLSYSYTGMHWRKKDRAMIRDMHRQLDAYWQTHVVG